MVENITPDVKPRYSNVVNGKTVVKWEDLRDFILNERKAKMYALARMWNYNVGTLSNTISGRGKYPSSVTMLLALERHFGIVIEGDPYR